MTLLNIFPSLNGKKSAISGYGLLFLGIGGVLNAVGNCLISLELTQCYAEVTGSWEPLASAFIGLGFIGGAHKSQKIDDKIVDIKKTVKSTEKTAEEISVTTDIIEEQTI